MLWQPDSSSPSAPGRWAEHVAQAQFIHGKSLQSPWPGLAALDRALQAHRFSFLCGNDCMPRRLAHARFELLPPPQQPQGLWPQAKAPQGGLGGSGGGSGGLCLSTGRQLIEYGRFLSLALSFCREQVGAMATLQQ